MGRGSPADPLYVSGYRDVDVLGFTAQPGVPYGPTQEIAIDALRIQKTRNPSDQVGKRAGIERGKLRGRGALSIHLGAYGKGCVRVERLS